MLQFKILLNFLLIRDFQLEYLCTAGVKYQYLGHVTHSSNDSGACTSDLPVPSINIVLGVSHHWGTDWNPENPIPETGMQLGGKILRQNLLAVLWFFYHTKMAFGA